MTTEQATEDRTRDLYSCPRPLLARPRCAVAVNSAVHDVHGVHDVCTCVCFTQQYSDEHVSRADSTLADSDHKCWPTATVHVGVVGVAR